MQQQTTVSLWCERIIEAGWLLALSLIPIYFNLLSARHFEPDKATTLRAIVVIIVAAALVRALERLNTPSEGTSANNANAAASDEITVANPFAGLWQRLNNIPLAVPVAFYVLVFIFTTVTSVVPHTSFWGSYQRLQGTYTNLSYVLLFVVLISTLRRREQLMRLLTVTILTALAVACYGILQHSELDPLPWQGDVITRVASTMGNSIFVAAYLIMVVPLVLYRFIATTTEALRAPEPTDIRNDLLWALAYTMLVVGTLTLLLFVVKFGAVVRTADFRYWWVFPGAVMVSTALWVILAHPPESDTQKTAVPLWPGGLYTGYIVFFGVLYASSSGSPNQQIDTRMVNGLDWYVWLIVSIAAVGMFYVMALVLPRRSSTASRLYLGLQAAGMLVACGIMLVTIIFTQSRGPWLGLAAGLFVFFFLLLWQAAHRATERGAHVLAQRLRIVIGTWIAVTAAAGTFLVIFNFSTAPFFNELRQVPYIGRMGTLLETDRGTGRVRTLIWMGDEHAGGAVSLITANPLRTVIGWGPESMFVAYNPYYPPTLAHYESRGASPDRSHQAVLDELVTKGFLGLISYLFLLISFFMLGWRLMRSSTEWHWQVFFIACISIVLAHFVEGLTGIPIVSTLTMLWVTMGITVTGGMLAGHYRIGVAEQPQSTTAAEANGSTDEGEEQTTQTDDTPTTGKRRAGSGKGRRGGAGRGAAGGVRAGAARASSRRAVPKSNPAALTLYAVIIALALGGTWWFNLSTIYADMLFHEGQAFSEQSGAGLNERIVAMDKFIRTINYNPREDFYYLNLGRVMMGIAELQRSQGMGLGQEASDPDINDLLRLEDVQEVAGFVQSSSPLELMSYAEAVLRRAQELNELNKDHYANLARLNNFWFNWTQDPEKLRTASEWYSRANEVAPQDVSLLNEHSNVLLLLATYAGRNDPQAREEYLAQAEDLLARSQLLDPIFSDTTARLAEVKRLQGDLAEAADLYIEAIERNPEHVNHFTEQIIASYTSEPELLLQLRDAYLQQAEEKQDPLLYSIAGLMSVRGDDLEEAVTAYGQAAELEPDSLEIRRNYTIVLSDTQRYDEALSAAESALALAQEQEGKETEIAQFRYLINLLQPKVAGGE